MVKPVKPHIAGHWSPSAMGNGLDRSLTHRAHTPLSRPPREREGRPLLAVTREGVPLVLGMIYRCAEKSLAGQPAWEHSRRNRATMCNRRFMRLRRLGLLYSTVDPCNLVILLSSVSLSCLNIDKHLIVSLQAATLLETLRRTRIERNRQCEFRS